MSDLPDAGPAPEAAPLSPRQAVELIRAQREPDEQPAPPAPANGQDDGAGWEPPADPSSDTPLEAPPGDLPEPPPVFKVKLADGEREVALPDLLAGYSQGQDYTKKTQALAAERQKFAEEQAQVEQIRQGMLEVMQQMHPAQQEQEPNWVELANANPIEYLRKHAAFQEQRKQREALQLLQQQQAETERARLTQYAAAQHERLTERLPGWSDPAKRTSMQAEIAQYAQSIGFTPQELRHAYDGRMLEMAYKSMLYDRGVTRPVAPGARPSQPSPPLANGATGPASLRRASAQFDNRPTRDNALELVRAMRPRRPPT